MTSYASATGDQHAAHTSNRACTGWDRQEFAFCPTCCTVRLLFLKYTEWLWKENFMLDQVYNAINILKPSGTCLILLLSSSLSLVLSWPIFIYLCLSLRNSPQVSGRKWRFFPQVSLSNLHFLLTFLAFCTFWLLPRVQVLFVLFAANIFRCPVCWREQHKFSDREDGAWSTESTITPVYKQSSAFIWDWVSVQGALLESTVLAQLARKTFTPALHPEQERILINAQKYWVSSVLKDKRWSSFRGRLCNPKALILLCGSEWNGFPHIHTLQAPSGSNQPLQVKELICTRRSAALGMCSSTQSSHFNFTCLCTPCKNNHLRSL